MFRGPPPASYFCGPPRPTSIPISSQRQEPTTSASERQDLHTTPPATARFAHALRLHRLKTAMTSARNYEPYPHTPSPPRPISVPISQRQAPTTSERKLTRCKLFIFGIALVGIALIPLLTDQDCPDCNEVDPCPDDQENSRPEDFAARVFVAVLLSISGLLLLFCEEN